MFEDHNHEVKYFNDINTFVVSFILIVQYLLK